MVLFICLRCYLFICFFFFNDTATTEIYTLSLHDALPIFGCTIRAARQSRCHAPRYGPAFRALLQTMPALRLRPWHIARSEEHTSELQSRQYLVCRLLLEKKKNTNKEL